MTELAGRKALVIGSATGIGRAVVDAFAAAGADVAVADKGHADALDALVAGLRSAGRDAVALQVDVVDEASVAAAIQAATDRFGALDILVNNAGTAQRQGPFETTDTGEWDRVMAVNLRGVAFGMKHALPAMLARGYGRIINTASQLAHKPSPGNAAYCASKAGVVALTVSVAQEVARSGVTVNAVCPGPTDTPMWRAGDSAWNAWKAESLPIGRIGTPGEIAAAYVWLASDAASFMVGQSVSPNGGDVMW
ncbi:MAG: SDR family oxidoreductase [Azospirillaceae bacterium]